MAKVAVVIRHLKPMRPVTLCVITEIKDPEIIDMDHYLTSKAEEKIKEFKKAFVEFNDAEFYIDIVDLE